MRGLDPRIYGIAGIANTRCEDVDGRIKFGHDDSELHKRHCALGSAPIANFSGQPCAFAGTTERVTRLLRPARLPSM
jgi:hypothetical protein